MSRKYPVQQYHCAPTPRKHPLAASIATLSIEIIAPFGTCAQNKQKASNVAGELIVTAQSRKQNIQVTPISGTAMPGDVLKEHGQQHTQRPRLLEPCVGINIDNVYYGTIVGGQFEQPDLNRLENLH